MPEASDITRRAKSNLAIALRLLPADRREDMTVFYAFCRTIDDIADDEAIPAAERIMALDDWEKTITCGSDAPDAFRQEVRDLIRRRDLPVDFLSSIINGCRSDVDASRRFQTWDGDLENYCWKVASAVGLVSVRLFGCSDLPAADHYATHLGLALQLTNILRDVGEDLDRGRIYLPLADLHACGLVEDDLFARRHDDRFVRAAGITAARADHHYQLAASSIPAADFATLLPARVMAAIYQELLGEIRNSGFRVLDRRHRVAKTRQLAILARHLVARQGK